MRAVTSEIPKWCALFPMAKCGPLHNFCIGMGIFGLLLAVGYAASGCEGTLDTFGYNFLGKKLLHPDCGSGAYLFLVRNVPSRLRLLFE